MAVQPEDINKLEQKVYEDDEAAARTMMVLIREKQPHLHEWLVVKFNTLKNPRVLLGVALSAMVLMQEEVDFNDSTAG